MKIIKNILIIVLSVILVCAIAAVALPKLFRINMLTETTSSMEPDITAGSLIITVPTGFKEIEVNDDIAYRRNEGQKAVIHRVISIDPDMKEIIAQGIKDKSADAPIKIENVIGEVKYVIPKAGYAAEWLATRNGKIIATAVFLALLLLTVLLSGKKRRKYG